MKEVRDRWQTLDFKPAAPKPPGDLGIIRLTTGVLCRYRGHSTVEVRRAFLEAWLSSDTIT